MAPDPLVGSRRCRPARGPVRKGRLRGNCPPHGEVWAMTRGWRRAAVAALALALLGVPGLLSRATAAGPFTDAMAGGEWATYGGDLQGTQRQDLEDTIGVGNVASLERAWMTDDTGYQSPPPIVSGGCVF